MKFHTEKFWFMIFHTILSLVQSYSVLGSIKYMGLSKFMVELGTYYYLLLKNMMLFTIGLEILSIKDREYICLIS